MHPQLSALVSLRWHMIREPRVRWGLVLLSLVPLAFCALGIFALQLVPDDEAFNISVATPTLYLGFALLAVIAPLAAGGGYELYPSEELVAYPVKPRTVFRGTLMLAPANLAWTLNVAAVIIVTSLAVGNLTWLTLLALLSALAYITMVTVFGQAFAWWIVGIRQSRNGRLATWAVAGVCVLAVLVIVRLGLAFDALDAAPTRLALLNAIDGHESRYVEWLVGISVMVFATAALLHIGVRATAWSLRRPGDHAHARSSRPVPRRTNKRSKFGEVLAVDRASVWRSLPLRRGIVVLLLLPGAVAAAAGMPWQSLILLPGLVAAGAGLLFGINAFALDAGGATWLATLPGWPRYAFASKMVVLTEIALLAVGSALLGGALRAPPPRSTAEVTAAILAALACTSLVVASGMKASLRNPHRAELAGTRDTPAPPGVMALHSIRLAVLTTFVSLLFSGAAASGVWWIPFVLAVPVFAWSGLNLIEAERAWLHPHVRGFVVTTVSGG